MSPPATYQRNFSAAVVHGSGYVGRELVRLLMGHSSIHLETVVSSSAAGNSVADVHPSLRGACPLTFSNFETSDLDRHDVVFVAGIPGTGVATYKRLAAKGFDGTFIDLSTDFRFKDPAEHLRWNCAPREDGVPAEDFVYGLPEICGPYPAGTRLVANPGCFATGLALSIWPVVSNSDATSVKITALTGASGSGATPSKTTHFPDRDGNVRAYKVFTHRHVGEVLQAVGRPIEIAFVPVSGPWTRGIWGTAHFEFASVVTNDTINIWFKKAYMNKPFVRMWTDRLPELHYAVDSPFFDVGWQASGRHLVVGFALDNLLKGAASQAIQNANLALGLPESLGLLPSAQQTSHASVDPVWN